MMLCDIILCCAYFVVCFGDILRKSLSLHLTNKQFQSNIKYPEVIATPTYEYYIVALILKTLDLPVHTYIVKIS